MTKTALIFCALSEEYRAVRSFITDPRDTISSSGEACEHGEFGGRFCQWKIITYQIGPLQANAAAACTRAAMSWQPDVALFVGVAGSLRDLVIGDVVAADIVYGFQSREEREATQARPRIGESSQRLRGRAQAVASKQAWIARTGDHTRTPRAVVKPIASGDALLASRRAPLYKWLRKNCGDAVALDMESFGFHEAMKSFPLIQAMAIRGISDLADGGEKDLGIASRNAAAFAFDLLDGFNFTTAGEASDLTDTQTPTKGLVIYDGTRADLVRQDRAELEWAWLCALPNETSPVVFGWNEIISNVDRLAGVSRQLATRTMVACISGKPGVGKSTLLLRLAYIQKAHYLDGVLYADLQGLSDQPTSTEEVLRRMLKAIESDVDTHLRTIDELSSRYQHLLKEASILVVLDNASDASHVKHLIPNSPRALCLISSRRNLPTLVHPPEGLIKLDTLAHDAARSLIGTDIGLTRLASESSDVDALLELCGYLPLAIRIAGARLRARLDWPVALMNDLLQDELTRLRQLEVDDLAVKSCFFLSYRALSPSMGLAFRLAGFFPGPTFTCDLIASLCQAAPSEIQIQLSGLVERSLVEAVTTINPNTGESREMFSLHSLIRLYASDEFEALHGSEKNILSGRLIAYYVTLVTEAPAWGAWFEYELPNVMTAARIAQTLGRAEDLRSMRHGISREVIIEYIDFSEVEPLFNMECFLLEKSRNLKNIAELWEEGALLAERKSEDTATVSSLIQRVLDNWVKVGDHAQLADARLRASCIFGRLNRPELAVAPLKLALDYYEDSTDVGAMSICLGNLMRFSTNAGDYETASATALRVSKWRNALPATDSTARTFLHAGWANEFDGEDDAAEEMFLCAATLFVQVRNPINAAIAYASCAKLVWNAEPIKSLSYIDQAFDLVNETADNEWKADLLAKAGHINALAKKWHVSSGAYKECFRILRDLRYSEPRTISTLLINITLANAANGVMPNVVEMAEVREYATRSNDSALLNAVRTIENLTDHAEPDRLSREAKLTRIWPLSIYFDHKSWFEDGIKHSRMSSLGVSPESND